MPKMAQNGPKWPKLGPNTFYFGIFRLKMTQLYAQKLLSVGKNSVSKYKNKRC